MTHPATTTGGRRAGRITALSAAAALGLAFTSTAAPAWAHDSLISSSPEAGELLETSPQEITLEFSGAGLTAGESITNLIAVSDAEGESWEGETEVEGSTMRTELPEELPGGDYTVAYRVVYSDGHAEEQSFDFEVAESEPEAEPAPAPSAGTEAEPPAPQQDDDAEQSDHDASEPASDQDSGLLVWGAVLGAAVVLGALTALAVAVLRGRRKPRPGGR